MRIVYSLGLCLSLLMAGQSMAGFMGGPTGQGAINQSVLSVTNSTVTNTVQWGFDERQGVTLASALAVDGGFIAAGTIVDSHMIFLNNGGGSGTRIQTLATWKFDGIILGVMSDNDGNLESASTSILGKIGATYGAPFNNRGLEANTGGVAGRDGYSIIGAGDELRLSMNVTQPGDWIRVVTAAPVSNVVPEPTTMALWGLGVTGFGLIARRRRK